MTTRVFDHLGSTEVPEFWAESNWARPYRFLQIAATANDAELANLEPRRFLYDKVISGFDFQNALKRRSLTADAGRTVTRLAFESTLRCVYQILAEEPTIVCGVLTADVEGWKDAAWVVDTQPRSIHQVPRELSGDDFSELIQGQAWGYGPGIGIVLGVDWDGIESGPAHLELAYARTLVSIGRAGQALLLEAQRHGLAARMTPAVKESHATELFQLDPSIDMLYAMRLSTPRDAA